MDASRYTAYEDGYLFKQAAPNAFQQAFTPASPGYARDDVRGLINQNSEMSGYSNIKAKYLDMAAAAINKDWLLGILSDETKRKYFSGGAGGIMGAGLGGMMGGASGALIGGALGALAGYLMDAFDIGLPQAYETLFKARAEGTIKDVVMAADAKNKADPTKENPRNTVAEQILASKDNTDAALIMRGTALDNMIKNTEDPQKKEKLRRAKLKNDDDIKQRIVTTESDQTAAGYNADAIAKNHGLETRKAFTVDIRKHQEKVTQLQLKKKRLERYGLGPEALVELDEQITEANKELGQVANQASSGTGGFNYDWSLKNMVTKNPLMAGRDVKEWGRREHMDKRLAKATSHQDIKDIMEDYALANKQEMDALYPGGVKWHDAPSMKTPNRSPLPWKKTRDGYDEDETFQEVHQRALDLGAKIDKPPVVFSDLGRNIVEGTLGKSQGTQAAKTTGSSKKNKFVRSLGSRAGTGVNVIPRAITGTKRTEVEAKPKTGVASKGPTEETNKMWKEFSGNDTPMWWEVLSPKHASEKQAAQAQPLMWWEVLSKQAGLPADPGAMIPDQPQASGPDANTVFAHQSKVTEMKAEAALEGAKADAEIKKKQAEMQLSGQQAGLDMQNKRFDVQNDQAQTAQQQATAQSPVANQSPQMPTATLQQPTAAGASMAPTPAPVAPQV